MLPSRSAAAATAAASGSVINIGFVGVHQVSVLDERNAQLDREKAALADLLAAKKREYDQMRQHYRDRVVDLEDEIQKLKAEKLRLIDKLQLPESERGSLVAQVSMLQRHAALFRPTKCGPMSTAKIELLGVFLLPRGMKIGRVVSCRR